MNQTPSTIRMVILEGLHQIAPEADLDSLTDDVDFRRELEIDSFDFLRLLVIIHEKLAVEFPESDYGQLRSIAALVNYVEAKLTKLHPSKSEE